MLDMSLNLASHLWPSWSTLDIYFLFDQMPRSLLTQAFHDCCRMWFSSAQANAGHNCCIPHRLYASAFWNSTELMAQWAPAGCMGADLEAINGDSKGKHRAKCQLWWLHWHNITSGQESQITKINNLIISYSNHAAWSSGSYCSFISPVCWCIPIRGGRCIENRVSQSSRSPTNVNLSFNVYHSLYVTLQRII